MENLNAEQVKKALERCSISDTVNGLTYQGECIRHLLIDALALINSQEQRIGAQDMTISELRKRVEKAEHDADRYAQRIKELMSTSSLQGAIIGGLRITANELTTDKERLEKLLDDKCDRCIERERADTVRKMQERLKADAVTIQDHTGKLGVVVGVGNIDDVAREMLEGEQ